MGERWRRSLTLLDFGAAGTVTDAVRSRCRARRHLLSTAAPFGQ
jgi:hypothetical protein